MKSLLNISLIAVMLSFAGEVSGQDLWIPFKDDNGKWGFRDMESDKVVIQSKYDEIGFSFMNGLCRVKVKDKFGFINKKGEMVIPAEYDVVGDFSQGLAFVNKGRREATEDEAYVPGLYGFVDTTGKLVVPLKYSYAVSFNEGRALVELDEKIGFIDTTGRLVIPIVYYVGDLYFKNGKALVNSADGREFYIDKDGKEIKEENPE
ncbi:MAG: WG repeat-containing protein [Chitinophagaceae bacterium]|nr:WG repeat-containing protein [Chitinophagaceae bacterium]